MIVTNDILISTELFARYISSVKNISHISNDSYTLLNFVCRPIMNTVQISTYIILKLISSRKQQSEEPHLACKIKQASYI